MADGSDKIILCRSTRPRLPPGAYFCLPEKEPSKRNTARAPTKRNTARGRVAKRLLGFEYEDMKSARRQRMKFRKMYECHLCKMLFDFNQSKLEMHMRTHSV